MAAILLQSFVLCTSVDTSVDQYEFSNPPTEMWITTWGDMGDVTIMLSWQKPSLSVPGGEKVSLAKP